MTIKVLHLVGSPVSEFFCDLSRLYANDCLEATRDPERYEFVVAYVTPDLQWRFPTDLSREAIAAANSMPIADALQQLTGVDVMIPQMFCLPGMTHYRALFDVLGIPYVGNTPDLMALAANKHKAKAVVAAAGIRVPSGELLHPGDEPTMQPPAVIKPVDTDNSVGLGLVRQLSEYPAALAKAFEHTDDVMVEDFIELGREVRCGIIVQGGELVCLPLEEYNVDAVTRPIRSYEDKISQDDHGDLNLVAKEVTKAWIVDTTDPITRTVWEAARACHKALGCRDYSLFDFRIDPNGEPWFLEAGLYSSFATKSVISVMAKAAGISLPDLFYSAIEQAVKR